MCSVIFLLVLAAFPALISTRLVNSYDNFPEESIDVRNEISLGPYSTMDDTIEDAMDDTTEDAMGDTEDIFGIVNQLISKVTALEKTIKHRCHRPVAFHAVRDGAVYPHLGVYQHVVFSTVLLNIGNGYNANHGIFTAPKAGLYIFSASILSDNRPATSLFAADIVRNGYVLARIYGKGVSGYHTQGSATVVTQLTVGQQIWVRLNCCANGSLFGVRYTTFSGSLISVLN
ncbi:complement C1q-like protein 4 [Mercenaria mercenaria]|uniref:complement C1q-like protein 4 n=1 Tax=Mercenaria mercenaria TaxID=6596 RepID=UPI00234E8F22|nr:complement C1q-like protein 4 [Mercenaria mercenaria]